MRMKEVRTLLFWRAVAAEFVGVLLFVFAGLSAIVGGGESGAAQELKVSLAFALAIATLAHSLGHVSGAHLNPAVSLGLMFGCRISAARCVFYVAAQVVGAVAASGVVNWYRPGESLGVNKLNVRVGPGFAIEFLATLQLVLCVMAVTDKRRGAAAGSAPLAIGLSVGLAHLAAISFTGCGINPARSFGPAVVRGQMDDHWVYWLAPVCGGAAAAPVYDFLLFPAAGSIRSRARVLVSDSEERSAAADVPAEEDVRPGPSHRPEP